jgi:hypothetical protein
MRNRSSMMVSINELSYAKRAQVVRCLVEGNSIRATVRMTGVAKNTVASGLLIVAGVASVLRGQAPVRPRWLFLRERPEPRPWISRTNNAGTIAFVLTTGHKHV